MRPTFLLRALGPVLFLGIGGPWAAAPAEAQDVELLGRIYGTRPPDAYFQQRQRPGAFEFQRALTPRLHRVLDARTTAGFDLIGAPPLEMIGAGAPANVVLGPRVGVVQGRFRFPVVLGLFADSPDPPFTPAEIQREYFTGPNSRYRTIPEFYDEVSGGRVQLEGETFPWVRSPLTNAQVGGGSAGLGSSSRMGEYIMGVLRELDDAGVDWGQFDNDGPDGIPNSGDDDGFVDILIVLHPTRGAECTNDRTGNRIWSHRWSLEAWMGQGQSFATSTPSRTPGIDRIRISDYTAQGLISCTSPANEQQINEIGVMAHELGHGFGLPDLYNTGSGPQTGGVGNWDLMATGAWGCTGGSAARPCHMGAWSKAVLGWADIRALGPGQDHGVVTLPPVNTTGQVLQIPAGDGSGEFFLLENRQRVGFDLGLVSPGLLIWHVDPEVIGDRLTAGTGWRANRVNVNRNRPGVWLRQADGRDDLAQSTARGDAGDPFPGSTGNRTFHAGSNPASFSHRGRATGVTLLDLTESGNDLSFRLIHRFQSITLEADGAGGGSTFLVNGSPASAPHTFPSAPFETHTVEALAGASLGPGIRSGFEAWEDGAPRSRTVAAGTVDTTFAARFGRREVQLDIRQTGGQPSVEPGTVQVPGASSDGWVAEGSQITVEARPTRGFQFREWSGALSGSTNPVSLTVSAPMQIEARYDLVYGARTPASLAFEAAREVDIVLQVEHATAPVVWTVTSGVLPDGLEIVDTRLRGRPLESGAFPVTLQVVDAVGLTASTAVALQVSPPVIGTADLAGPFLQTQRSPDPDQVVYLDRAGNRNGFYDLGDLRAFFLANPDLPMTSQDRGVQRRVLPLAGPGAGGGE